jgi:hypothetical protein
MNDSPFGRGCYLYGNFEMNFLDGLFILAAGGKDRDFSWVVPVAFVAIWIIGGIGKVIASARENQKQREKQKPAPGQPENEMRYKPIPDASSQHQHRERAMPQIVSVPKNKDRDTIPGREKAEPKRTGTVAALKKAMHDAMEEAQMQQGKRQAPKQAVRKPKKVQHATTRKVSTKRKPVAKEPVREVEVMPQEGSVLRELLERENIRKAIIYSEILGKPLAMRDS